MGVRPVDRSSVRDIAGSCVTFADFARRQFELHTVCSTCQLTMKVNFKLISMLRQDHLSPWDRRPRCPKITHRGQCPGRADYWCKHPKGERFHKLTRAIPEDGLE